MVLVRARNVENDLSHDKGFKVRGKKDQQQNTPTRQLEQNPTFLKALKLDDIAALYPTRLFKLDKDESLDRSHKINLPIEARCKANVSTVIAAFDPTRLFKLGKDESLIEATESIGQSKR